MYKANELLRQSVVAKLIGVSNAAVNQKIDAKHLEFKLVGGVRFVPYRAVKKWKKERAERARKLLECL